MAKEKICKDGGAKTRLGYPTATTAMDFFYFPMVKKDDDIAKEGNQKKIKKLQLAVGKPETEKPQWIS